MLPEISLNVLDIAENSIRAGADLIQIEVLASTQEDTLTILIEDNGCGMNEEQVSKVTDPRYTTRTTRKVGLGIPLFKQAAEGAGGQIKIVSREGAGTKIKAIFGLSHMDRMPLGDINTTIHTLIVFHEPIEFRYKYAYDRRSFVLDTRQMRRILGGISLKEAEVSQFIKEYLAANKAEADAGKTV